MKATITTKFMMLFLYGEDIDDDNRVLVDEDCAFSFEEGDVVEVLKTLEVGEYAKNQKSYVIFHPVTKETLTVAACFLEIIEGETK